jgi:hypothetical protein
MENPLPNPPIDRLDAWFDGSAVCVVAVSAHGDPLDLSDEEVEAFIEKLQVALSQSRGDSQSGNAA